jgi:hypothetical protein
MSATSTKDAPAQVAPELLTVARRPAPYRVESDAARGVTGEGSFVTRGVHVKSGAPALVHVDGSAQSALPLGVIGAAILYGVITDEEIAQLQSLRGK